MKERIAKTSVYKIQPALYKSLGGLGEAAASSLEHSLVHLVKLRASQINGCAFCQHMHTNEARKDGEKQSRLDVLPAWREVPVFSARERAALEWTEAATRLSTTSPDEAQFSILARHFTDEEIVNLTITIATINAWNRIAVSFNFFPDFKDLEAY
jgi:AhpD family alkylhydroperoxidase